MCHQSTFLLVCVRFNETWHQLQAGVRLPSPAQPCWSSFTLVPLGGSKEPVVGLCWTKEDAQIELSNQRSKDDPGLSTAHTVASWNQGWQRLDHLELRRPSEGVPTPSGALAPVLGSVWGLPHRSPMTHVSTETLNRTKELSHSDSLHSNLYCHCCAIVLVRSSISCTGSTLTNVAPIYEHLLGISDQWPAFSLKRTSRLKHM